MFVICNDFHKGKNDEKHGVFLRMIGAIPLFWLDSLHWPSAGRESELACFLRFFLFAFCVCNPYG